MEFGYALSSNEHAPDDLLQYARRAEEVGFSFAFISDHYHPWLVRPDHNPFAWGVLGSIAEVTERLRVGTGVTCPLIRYHPALVAQAIAMASLLLPDRFFLSVGIDENSDAQSSDRPAPCARLRRAMLTEVVEIVRALWQGRMDSYFGCHCLFENARAYSRPDAPPPIVVAASGNDSARLAGQVGDGLMSSAPNGNFVDTFAQEGGNGKPCYGQITVCWAPDEAAARRTAVERGLHDAPYRKAALSSHCRPAVELAAETIISQATVCGPDPDKHIARIREFAEAGYDHIYFRQVGPDQEGFFQFYAREVLPHVHSAVNN